MMWIMMSRILVTIVYFALVLILIWIMMWIMLCKVCSNFLKSCTYLEFDMDIDVVICCVELVTIVLKFCTCELLEMDNGVDYYM